MAFSPFSVLTVDDLAADIEAQVAAAVEAHVAASLPAGTIVATGRSTAPDGWLLCQGQAVDRSTYEGLFDAIGTAYGNGDGSTTFNLPDLRQRFPLGKAASGTGVTLGSAGGAIDHVHDLDNATAYAKVNLANNVFHTERLTVIGWTETVSATGISTLAASAAQTLGTGLGGDTADENPPYQVVNFMVRT